MKNMKRTSGFTLIEILITVGIIVLVTALALPTVKDALKSNTISRSASLVSGSIVTARALAVQKGLPCGVLIERRRTNYAQGDGGSYIEGEEGANYSAQLSYVQVPSKITAAAAAYPYVSLENASDNCSKRYHYYVKKEDAELLYAASRGETFASRLIGIGTQIKVRDRISTIVALTTLDAGLNENVVQEYTGRPEDLDCGSAVIDPTGAQIQAGPGVRVTTADTVVSEKSIGGTVNGSGPDSGSMTFYTGYDLEITLNPIKAALSPLNLPGRTVIDLSVSGSRENPLAFNAQEISGLNRIDNKELHGVMLLFSPDGRLDSVYVDQWNDNGQRFDWVRFDPPPSISLLVGQSNGVLGNVDLAANYPTSLFDGPLYEPPQLLNFVNNDCHWVTIDSSSGHTEVSPVASQPNQGFFEGYYDLDASSDARTVVKRRIEQSRQLAYGGAL